MFTLGRKIDIHYSTNRKILILSILVAAIGWIVTGEIRSGAYIGGGTFLTWALAREVDPKHEYSAFVCVAFSLLNLYYYENIQLLVFFWIILIMRLVSGITGKEITFVDVFSVLGMTIYLSFNNIDYSNAISIFVIIMVFISFIFWSFLSKDEIRDDLGNLVKRSKVLLSQIIYSLAGLLIYFFGDMSVNNLIIYLSVIIGVIIYWTGYKLLAKGS